MNKQKTKTGRGIEWRRIPSAPGYFASADGQILSRVRRKPKIMKPILSKSGHGYIFVQKKKRWIHHLVLEAFGFSRPSGLECRHLDGNPANNHIHNLQWGTSLENSHDRFRHGTMLRAEDTLTPLTRQQVSAIRALSGSKSSRTVGAEFGVSHTTIQKIWRQERWN